jgi:hypothetical protein
MWAVPKNDSAGENAVECGAIAIASVDCSDAAGCEEHALLCPGVRQAGLRILRG